MQFEGKTMIDGLCVDFGSRIKIIDASFLMMMVTRVLHFSINKRLIIRRRDVEG